jgi:hypothetical protein
MVMIANLTYDALGEKNLVFDAAGKKNLIANYAPVPYNETTTVTRDNDDRWTVSWDSTDAPYELYLQGDFVATVEDQSFSFVSVDEPALEVYDVDVTADPYTVINKPYADIQWFSPESQSYLVDRYLAMVWRRQGRPVAPANSGYRSINTGFLGDDLEENWRVTPRNEFETAGTPVEEPFNVVSHPNPPETTATITAGSLIIGSV